MTLQAIKYDNGHLTILDQLYLPHVAKFVPIRSAEDGWHAIKEMRVRGAPAIAIVAALALAAELQTLVAQDKLSPVAEEVQVFIVEKLRYLVTSRPTAVNLSDAAHKLRLIVEAQAREKGSTGRSVAAAFLKAAEQMLASDLDDNKKIGHNGAKWIVENALRPGKRKVDILTHCNTG